MKWVQKLKALPAQPVPEPTIDPHKLEVVLKTLLAMNPELIPPGPMGPVWSPVNASTWEMQAFLTKVAEFAGWDFPTQQALGAFVKAGLKEISK